VPADRGGLAALRRRARQSRPTSAESGKEQGTDLRQGVRTLPVLYALRAATQAGAGRDNGLRELLDADLTDPELHAEALGLLRELPSAVEEARQRRSGRGIGGREPT